MKKNKKQFEIIEEGRFMTTNKLNLISGGDTELCDESQYSSCTPYTGLCYIYNSCKMAYEIRPCYGERQYSCKEFYIACYRQRALCLPGTSYVSPCPSKKLVD